LTTLEERFDYLSLQGVVGYKTFGFDRWINQQFYQSREWRRVRDVVIIRDNGCDLGVPGYEIAAGLLVHHINPMTPEDIESGETWILDPEFLITTTQNTHNAIHYGDRSLLPQPPVLRERGDTSLWTPIRRSHDRRRADPPHPG
jgi:hypothetical protein